MVWMILFGVAAAGTFILLYLQGAGKQPGIVEGVALCAECPALTERDPLKAVALVMTALSRHCGQKDLDVDLIHRALQPLSQYGDLQAAANYAVSHDCGKLQSMLDQLAPHMVSSFRFAERGQIVAMAETIITESGGGADVKQWALPLLRRRLALSAR